jgi:hypothetical protein
MNLEFSDADISSQLQSHADISSQLQPICNYKNLSYNSRATAISAQITRQNQ